MNISKGRKTYHGVNGILTHYNIIWDPYIGLGIFSIRRIPCDCIDLINSMYLPWDPYIVPKYQPIYYSVKKENYPILGKHNDW